MAPKNGMRPIHPGEVLREEFMKPLALSANAVARDIRVPPNRVTALINEERAITADTAVRLGRYFGTTPEFWMNLQTAYDLRRVSKDVVNDVKPYAQRKVS